MGIYLFFFPLSFFLIQEPYTGFLCVAQAELELTMHPKCWD